MSIMQAAGLGGPSYERVSTQSEKDRNSGRYDKDVEFFPCKTNKIRREIPPSNWYTDWRVQYFMAGFLPFSAIYIELHYVFISVWGERLYTVS